MTSSRTEGAARAIAVNLMWCRPGRVGGSEEYLCRQLLGLPRDSLDITVFAPRGFARIHADIAQRHTVIEMSHDAESRPRRIFDESSWLYRRTRPMDLVHHGGGTVPVIRRHPIVLTVHDLQYLEYPQYFSRPRLQYLRWAMPRALRTADMITVPTEFVRRTVLEHFSMEPDDVVVVPHGIESEFGAAATDERELRTRHGLGDGPIVVFPAVTHPHKGHEFLLEVQSRFWTERGVTLVLIGGHGSAEDRLQKRIAELGLSESVRRLGRVSTEDRDGLIRMSRALVFPSEYEGFGAPVIEAMALGVPVITSDRACLPEVVDRAGIVLPLDVEAWKGALDEVDARRSEFAQLGLARSRHFTSSISGEALARVYRELLDRPVGGTVHA